MTIKNENVSSLWPITLIGFIVTVILFILSAVISPFGNEGDTISTFTMCTMLFLINCAFINIFFCFATLNAFWDKLSFSKTVMYFLVLLIFNFLSCYIFAKLWKKHSEVDIYSVKDKKKLNLQNPLYFFFSFFTLISFTLPLFIAGQQ